MEVKCWFLLLLVVIFGPKEGTSAKILGIFPFPGYSQFILAEKLMKELTFRGHEVTVISVYKPKEAVKNYKTVVVEIPVVEQGDLFALGQSGIFYQIKNIHAFGMYAAENVLKHPNVQQLINSNQTFDLVIIEQLYNEALMGFAHHFKAPLVLFSSVGTCEWNIHVMDTIFLPSISPLSLSGYNNQMGLYQRFSNALMYVLESLHWRFVVLSKQQQLLDQYFPEKIGLDKILYNASIMLLNSHWAVTEPSILSNRLIEIGGYHITHRKLPEEIKQFLDNATDGAIFFSMGSNIKSANLGKEKLNAVLNVVRRIKQKVLWKFEEGSIEKPDNLLISKWMPQSDILNHPNTIGFISHGGLLSTIEAVDAGVPMVAIPIFVDQKMNVARLVHRGLAVHLSFKHFNEENLYNSLMQVVKNESYRANAKLRSKYLRDQLVPPLDKAMFWIEYVLRHGGVPEMKNQSQNLSWFQIYLLDVCALIAISICLICFAIKQVLACLYKNKKSLKEKKME